MSENALMIRESVDLIQIRKQLTSENAILRSRLDEREAYIAELSAKLKEREAHCKTLRRQRNKYITLLKEQSSREFLTKLTYTSVAVFLMAATIYALNSIALVVMRWAAFM